MEPVIAMDMEEMKNVDIRTVDRESLADINDVHNNRKLPREERMADFIRQIKNPYCYRCGKAVVKVGFTDTEVTLEDRLEHYLKTL